MTYHNNESAPKKVLVTGASSGIGNEVAHRLVALNHSVFVTGRNDEKLNQIGGVSGSLSGDLTLPAFVGTSKQMVCESSFSFSYRDES